MSHVREVRGEAMGKGGVWRRMMGSRRTKWRRRRKTTTRETRRRSLEDWRRVMIGDATEEAMGEMKERMGRRRVEEGRRMAAAGDAEGDEEEM